MTAVATIGFGEAAKAFVSGWRSEAGTAGSARVASFDVKIEDPLARGNLLRDAEELDVECCACPAQAVLEATLVFSLVTADKALEAAERVAKLLRPGTFYLDCNSCSPATKQAAAKLVEKAGGAYVDVAVMSPVYPARHKTPLLVSGHRSEEAQDLLTRFGMNAKTVGLAVGNASSIKMLRSVMIKGLEALTAECFLAARRAGVDAEVIASLQASDPGLDWAKRGAYNLERMMVHGKRRAAEMREVAATLRELNLPDRMALAAAEWQDEVGTLEIRAREGTVGERADSVLERFRN